MLLLLFTGVSSGPVAAPSGHPGFSKTRRTRVVQAMPRDDDQALQVLLDAEYADVLEALMNYETALRRVL